jgi:hypothetical protein
VLSFFSDALFFSVFTAVFLGAALPLFLAGLTAFEVALGFLFVALAFLAFALATLVVFGGFFALTWVFSVLLETFFFIPARFGALVVRLDDFAAVFFAGFLALAFFVTDFFAIKSYPPEKSNIQSRLCIGYHHHPKHAFQISLVTQFRL